MSKRVQSRYVISIMHFYFAFERPAGALSSAFTLPPSFIQRIRSGEKLDVSSSVAPTAGSRRQNILWAAAPASCCPATMQQSDKNVLSPSVSRNGRLGATDRTDTSQLGWTSINESSAPEHVREVWRVSFTHRHLAKFLSLRSIELRPGAELPHEFVTPSDGSPGPHSRAMKRCIDRGGLRIDVLQQPFLIFCAQSRMSKRGLRWRLR